MRVINIVEHIYQIEDDDELYAVRVDVAKARKLKGYSPRQAVMAVLARSPWRLDATVMKELADLVHRDVLTMNRHGR